MVSAKEITVLIALLFLSACNNAPKVSDWLYDCYNDSVEDCYPEGSVIIKKGGDR